MLPLQFMVVNIMDESMKEELSEFDSPDYRDDQVSMHVVT